jgi:hypothetical protein
MAAFLRKILLPSLIDGWWRRVVTLPDDQQGYPLVFSAADVSTFQLTNAEFGFS